MDSLFYTSTMMEILLKQGDESGARNIRQQITTEPFSRAELGTAELIATLERWLEALGDTKQNVLR